MAKKRGGGKLLPLPFTTFGEIAALGLKASVYCSRCYAHRPIDPAAGNLRERCFETTRTKIRYTGNVCGYAGSIEIEPSTGRRRSHTGFSFLRHVPAVVGDRPTSSAGCQSHRAHRASLALRR
jgi:hypothetical protein